MPRCSVILVLLIAGAARTSGPFSPDSAEPSGAKALAALLENHGVDVTGTEDLKDATDSRAGKTLLIAPGGSLSRSDWQDIAQAGWSHVVLMRPSSRALDVFAPGVESASQTMPSDSRSPACDLPAAVKAGTATVGGVSYSAPDSAITCYGDGINHTVIRLDDERQIVDVVGLATDVHQRPTGRGRQRGAGAEPDRYAFRAGLVLAAVRDQQL